jgi:REP element-mobilizing transposase RayT
MIEKRHGGRLPHWRLSGGLYFVTFRLHDALPKERVQAIREWVEHEERRESERLNRPLSSEERSKVRARSTGRLDRALDEGHGECHLLQCSAAQTVMDTMRREAGYRLHAFAVMPNNVHALVQPFDSFELSNVVGAWKSISARSLVASLGLSPPVWQTESFDHLVRNVEKAEEYRQYILDNPRKAGLVDWPFAGAIDYGFQDVVWPFSSDPT